MSEDTASELLCCCPGRYPGCSHGRGLASCSQPADLSRTQFLCKDCEDNRGGADSPRTCTMTLDGLCLWLRGLTNRRLCRFEPTRVICLSCDESVSEWVTIRWQLTDKDHRPCTDGATIAQICVDCAVPIRMALTHEIQNTVRQVCLAVRRKYP